MIKNQSDLIKKHMETRHRCTVIEVDSTGVAVEFPKSVQNHPKYIPFARVYASDKNSIKVGDVGMSSYGPTLNGYDWSIEFKE